MATIPAQTFGSYHLISRRFVLLLAACFFCVITSAPFLANAASKNKGASEPVTQVYFIRGFMGVFSTGFDAMAKKLNKKNVRTQVFGHLSGSTIRANIIKQWAQQRKRHKPIVLVGHSFGGNAAFEVAALLAKEDIPVALVITVDPTRAGPVSTNVKSYVNYYFPGNGLGTKLKAKGKVSSSRIKNIDMRDRQKALDTHDGHWTVTSNDALQSEIMKTVSRVAR